MLKASQEHQDKGEDQQKGPHQRPIETQNLTDKIVDPPPSPKPPYYGGPKGEGQGQEHQGQKGHKQ